MQTVKIKKSKTKMIAHRGLSGIEPQNTSIAFAAAGNRSYFGIETDVHITKDGKYVIIHDDVTSNVSNTGLTVENTDFEVLRNIYLNDNDGSAGRKVVAIGKGRVDLRKLAQNRQCCAGLHDFRQVPVMSTTKCQVYLHCRRKQSGVYGTD